MGWATDVAMTVTGRASRFDDGVPASVVRDEHEGMTPLLLAPRLTSRCVKTLGVRHPEPRAARTAEHAERKIGKGPHRPTALSQQTALVPWLLCPCSARKPHLIRLNSRSVFVFFLELHDLQAGTMFPGRCGPPRARGMRWSIAS